MKIGQNSLENQKGVQEPNKKTEENWEQWGKEMKVIQKESNSLKGKIAHMEKEAQTSNQVISKLETKIDLLEDMKCRIDQIKEGNLNIISENQSLNIRIRQIGVNDLMRQ